MKKLVISLVIGASLAIVPSAFALKAMSKADLKDTTGQAGVSIVVDDIMIYQSSFATTTYTDMDGIGDVMEEGGALTIETQHTGGTLTTLRAIVEAGDRAGYLQHNYSAILANNNMNNLGAGVNGTTDYDFMASAATEDNHSTREGLFNTAFTAGNSAGFIGRPIEIDVAGALRLATYGYSRNVDGTTDSTRIAGISIGLPTLEINRIMDGAETKIITISSTAGTTAQENYVGTRLYDNATGGVAGETVGYDGTDSAYDPVTNATYGARAYCTEFIRVTKSGNSTIAILGGTVEIAPH